MVFGGEVRLIVPGCLAAWLAGWLGVRGADMWLMFFRCPSLQTGVRDERQEVRNQLWLGNGRSPRVRPLLAIHHSASW